MPIRPVLASVFETHLQRLFMMSSSTPSQSSPILTQETLLAALKSDNRFQDLQRLFMSSLTTPSQSGPILTHEPLSAAQKSDNSFHYHHSLINTPSQQPKSS